MCALDEMLGSLQGREAIHVGVLAVLRKKSSQFHKI